jgi:ribosomal protein S18 acetylase RimI-like enzyme
MQEFLLPERLSHQEVKGSTSAQLPPSYARRLTMMVLESYRKFVTLSNGKKVLIRLLNGEDGSSLLRFLQQAPLEDVQFCKQDVKSPMLIDAWMNQKNYCNPMTLVALDMSTNRVVASLNLSRGQQAARNVGEIQQFLVARPFQGRGLGSLLLDGLIELAPTANLHWLQVEVILEMKEVIKAFQAKGFQTKTILDDYFVNLQGKPFDVALLLRPLFKNDYDDF